MECQTIYICLDDSGKLSSKEIYSTYGGLLFFSKLERDKFIRQYRSIIQDIKCHYCQSILCEKNCPEIKCSRVEPAHLRRILNYLKKFYVLAAVIKNKEVYPSILQDKASKGRFLDYCIKRLVKESIKDLIQKKKIDPLKPLKLIIEMDEQTTKSNGYYNLKDGLMEELKRGICNYNYGLVMMPILKGEVTIQLEYRNSAKTIVIQAADFVAGTIRRDFLTKHTHFIPNLKIEFPNEKKSGESS